MISLKTKVKRKNIFITKKISDKTVIFDMGQAKFYQLNDTAILIWKYLWKERTVSKLVDKIVQEFDIMPKTAEKDVIKFIEKYRDNLFFIND